MTETAAAVNDAGTASAAPATFADAFAADASPAAATPEQTTTPAEAEQPPAAQETPQQGEEREPFIPRQRFDEVNGKLNELKQWKEQRAWADQIDAPTFQKMAEWYQQAHQDPLAFTTSLIAELQAHPTYGPQLKSLAARTLAQRQQQPTGPDLESLVIDLGNGQTVPLSDLKSRWMQEVEQKFAPLQQTVEQVTADRQKAEAQSFATTSITQLRQLPGFKEHEADIKAELRTIQLPKDASAELVLLAAQAAYARVVPSKLQQATAQSAQSQLLDNLQKKAGAASVNPGSAAPSSPRRVDSFTDPSLKW